MINVLPCRAQGPGAALATPYEVPPQITYLSEALLSTVMSAAKILLSAHTLLELRVPHHPTIRHLYDELPPLDECCTFSEKKQYLKVDKLVSIVGVHNLAWFCVTKQTVSLCQTLVIFETVHQTDMW